ncbi:hypothetical protein Tco_1537430, partial [Tanacetum coccineum]
NLNVKPLGPRFVTTTVPDGIFNFKACERALKKVNIIRGEMLEEVTSKGGSTKVVLFEAIAKEVEDVVLDSDCY